MKLLTSLLALALFAASAWAGQPVNINTANAETIAEALTGVGQKTAEAIVAYRAEHGPFKHVDELVNVKGIGLRTVDKNRAFILLDEQKKG